MFDVASDFFTIVVPKVDQNRLQFIIKCDFVGNGRSARFKSVLNTRFERFFLDFGIARASSDKRLDS